ncbi:MAG TPA: glycine betaine ABC transporter substrate-binding protein [Bryobacteraceae bacterium]|nr:glycine betaine ABC transporter substrate-binding protein [Bryobacteraceae bacterium]
MKRRLTALFAFLLMCSCSKNAIVVGSKNFTEQLILGEIAAQQLERKLHVPVQRKLDLGGTLLTHEAIVRGDIDVYPEYTGTAASVVLKQPIPEDPVRAYMAVKDAYLQRFHLVWLPPLGFNDTFAMAVRTEDARKLTEPSLSAAASRKWRLGVGYEFLTRPDGLQRLNKMYGIHWDGTPKSMDLGLLYQALQQKSIDMGAGNSTDAQLSNPKFTALRDDRKAFPPYNACYVVRRELVEQKPQVEWALSMLQNRISDETMRDLNRRVDIEHQSIEKVAREFLASQP